MFFAKAKCKHLFFVDIAADFDKIKIQPSLLNGQKQHRFVSVADSVALFWRRIFMKRFILFVGVCLLVFSLAACSAENATPKQGNTSSVSTVKNDDLINEYVKNIAFLEKKSYDIFIENGHDTENHTSKVDKSSEGYLGYYVYDFDKDGENELLLISHRFKKPSCMDLSSAYDYDDGIITETESYLCIEMYEAEAGSVVKKDEAIVFTTGENRDGYSDLILFNYKDTVQIGFGRCRWGFYGDGQSTGFCAVKYNGKSFEKVMKEYWGGSGDADMFRNIIDKLNEVYGIPEEKICGVGQRVAFENSDWMNNNFDVIDKVLSLSVKPYEGSTEADFFNGQKNIVFKISWQ